MQQFPYTNYMLNIPEFFVHVSFFRHDNFAVQQALIDVYSS